MAASMLEAMPRELVEHVAFWVATDPFLGPPSYLPALLLANRRIHSYLSFDTNPHLYARIFFAKFDSRHAMRRARARSDTLIWTSSAIAGELRWRCRCLKRVRARMDLRLGPFYVGPDRVRLQEVLWTLYLMVLEGDSKNGRQLREYARLVDWLIDWWLDDGFPTSAKRLIEAGIWPTCNTQASLTLWLLWFLLKSSTFSLEAKPLDVVGADDGTSHPTSLPY
jgi:hypothetical protein